MECCLAFARQEGRGAPSGRVITWGIEWRHCCEAVGRLRRARARKEEQCTLRGVLSRPGDSLESPPRGWGEQRHTGCSGPALLSRQSRNTASPTESGELDGGCCGPWLKSWRSPNTEVLKRALALVLIPPAFEFQDCHFCVPPRPPPNSYESMNMRVFGGRAFER